MFGHDMANATLHATKQPTEIRLAVTGVSMSPSVSVVDLPDVLIVPMQVKPTQIRLFSLKSSY